MILILGHDRRSPEIPNGIPVIRVQGFDPKAFGMDYGKIIDTSSWFPRYVIYGRHTKEEC